MKAPADIKIAVKNFSVFQGQEDALRQISLDIPVHKILGIIGPSGSGKTTFLRALNRLNDLARNASDESSAALIGAM